MPKLMVIAIVDAIVFLMTFVMLFILNIEQRSFIFDVAISIFFLIKALLGLYYYKEKSYMKLRVYMTLRLLYNLLIGLIVIIFNYATHTYPVNFLACISLLAFTELVLQLVYATSLCRVQVEEALEGLDGFKLTQKNIESNSLLGQIDIRKTSDYILYQS